MAEGAQRHEAVEKHARLVIQPGGDVEIGQGGTEQIVNVGYLVQKCIRMDAILSVHEGHHEWHEPLLREYPASHQKCRAVSIEPGIHDVERQRRRALGSFGGQYVLEPLEDSLRVAPQVPEWHRESRHAERL